MKRLYFLANTLDNVSQVSEDLHQQGIDDWHIHVLSRNEAGLYRRHIHSTHLFQQSDIIHSGELGALIGGGIGLLSALLLELWIPLEPPLSTPILALIAGVFTLFGTWSGGLAGITRENYKTTRFHDDIEKGKHLIMIDVSKQQEAVVRQYIARYHPQIAMAGEDSPFTLPLTRHFWSIPRHN